MGPEGNQLVNISLLVAKLLLVLMLWFFPRLIITSTVPDEALSQEHKGFYDNLYPALFVTVGVFLVCYAIADLTYYAYLLAMLSSTPAESPAFVRDYAGLASVVVQLVLGLILIVGSGKIAVLVGQLRTTGDHS